MHTVLHIWLRRIATLVFVLGVFALPARFVYANQEGANSAVVVNTANPNACDCYCGTSNGAEKESTKMDIKSCEETCKVKKRSMIACAKSAAQAPDRSIYCFTEDQCKKQNGILDSAQAWDCVKGQRYCYPDPVKTEKVALSLAIPNPADPSKPLTMTGDIGEYINALFLFMINAGLTIVIVIIMVGGIQYTIGAATKDGVAKGKARIKNAVIGLVLLLCVRLIASTVNPYLVRLQVPKFPMVKQVGLPSSESSCEDYANKKDANGKFLYKLEIANGGKTVCGGSANVLAAEGQPAVAAGITCDYKACQAGYSCLGSGESAKCLTCEQVVEEEGQTVKASSGVCKQLALDTVTVQGKEKILRCGWTKDADVNKGVANLKVLHRGSCARVTIDCSSIKSCTDYDTVQVTNKNYTQPLEDIASEKDSLLCGGSCGDFGLKQICEENPCSSLKGGTIEHPCVFDGGYDCENP